VLQFVRPGIRAKGAAAEIQAPAEVRHILEKDCYSCHSDEVRLSWFDQIVPGYWLVRHDILTARKHLNFSTLGAKPAAVQKATLYEAVNMVQLGAMPLPRFVGLHPDAKVTLEELATLKAYLAPWRPAPDQPPPATADSTGRAPAVPPASGAPSARVALSQVQPEHNGLPFEQAFENWKPISTTDRGDNNTLRLILGNDIAVKAAESGNISPWPDGARFAKIAWQQQPAADGLVYPGKFVHVEFMVKDAKQFKSTEGWNWGRWRGADLKPYGTDARFVNECTGCHQPVRGDDYVYTLPVSGAKVQGNEVLNNAASALPAGLPFQPLRWGVVTMYIDPKAHTMATLYGNDAAMRSVQTHRDTAQPDAGGLYEPGSVLALVTWVQREDPHWFGARIPSSPQSVEFVQFGANTAPSYRRFAGAALSEQSTNGGREAERVAFVTHLAPAWLP
jgi:hypothetical protein